MSEFKPPQPVLKTFFRPVPTRFLLKSRARSDLLKNRLPDLSPGLIAPTSLSGHKRK